jgi:hypothetical protein
LDISILEKQGAMTTFQRFGFKLGAGCLVIMFSALTCIASCGVQNGQHAGYQGIPMRAGLDRGATQVVDTSAERRDPPLPRRINETGTDSAFAPSASVDSDQDCKQNDQERAGYRGIPRDNANADYALPIEAANTHRMESAGYRGIPRSVSRGELNMQQGNSFLGNGSALVRPK